MPQKEQERRIVRMLVNRLLRDAAFRTSVVKAVKAYGKMCAVTRLRIVKDGGPDIVQNGIARSANRPSHTHCTEWS